MSVSSHAALLVERLLSTDGDCVERTITELARVSTRARELTARELARRLRVGGPDALLVCRLLGRERPPRFTPSGVRRLMLALDTAERAGGPLAHAATHAAMRIAVHGHDFEHLEKVQRDRGEGSTHLARRILSVGGRVWVWVTSFFIGMSVAILYSMDVLSAWGAALASSAAVAAMVGVDAILRRCPSCRAWLAGHLLSIVQDGTRTTRSVISTAGGTVEVSETVNTHRHDWSCVFCKHRWHT
jgi:hypothetical protein